MGSSTYLLGTLAATTLVLGAWAASPQAKDEERVLFDFRDPDASKAWQNVNDDVMGGLSEGRLRITGRGTLEFYGVLSLENRGGFASVRSKPQRLGLVDGDRIVARVRGDGRQYYLNLLVPTRRVAFSYRASFETKPGKWQDLSIPLSEFQATSFGRPLKGAAPLEPAKVNSIGFLLADKKAGPFKLEVEYLKAARKTDRR